MDAVEELPEGDLFVGGAVVEGLEQGVPAFRLGAALGEQVGQGEVGFGAGEDFACGQLAQMAVGVRQVPKARFRPLLSTVVQGCTRCRRGGLQLAK